MSFMNIVLKKQYGAKRAREILTDMLWNLPAGIEDWPTEKTAVYRKAAAKAAALVQKSCRDRQVLERAYNALVIFCAPGEAEELKPVHYRKTPRDDEVVIVERIFAFHMRMDGMPGKTIAKELGRPWSTVRGWVRRIDSGQGRAFLRGEKRMYTQKEKADALELWFSGKVSHHEVSRRLGIPIKTIRNWVLRGID